ncbi:MAG: prepilin-type N-terminal cleavage/methylation domain-containing protein [Dictyoglomaceae bacterium]|nr:prepilin-type N-terminal cleavage/methylation domain-containing protein [Dictyoglomaceae bacterium]
MICHQKIGNKGFNLIEVLIVGLIISIAMLAVFQMYSYGLFQYPKISNLVQANHLLVREAENINSKTYTQIDNFLSSNYPKVVNIKNISFRLSYTLNIPYTWCKIITLYVSWRDGTQTKTLSLEILRSIP